MPADDRSLEVEITSVTPSALQLGDDLHLTGIVTNVDDQVWREVKAYLVISYSPMTSRSELAAVANSPAQTPISNRITDFGSYAPLGALDAGDTSPFQLDVGWPTLQPRILGSEGVYTIGVQVLATDLDQTRDPDGLARTRTFLPMVESDAGDPPARVDLGLLWPLREPVLRRGDGSYVGADQLRTSLDLGGRLRRLVDLAATADDVPLSVVVDPALLDAAEDFAAGDYGPPERTPPGSGGQSGDTDANEGDTGEGDGADPGADGADTAAGPSPEIRDWLNDVVDLFGFSGWVTGYGEPDPLVATTTHARRLRGAIARAGRTVEETLLGSDAPTLWLPDPSTPSAELGGLRGPDGDHVAVLSPERLPGWDSTQGTALRVPTPEGDLSVLVADPTLSAGGPRPGLPGSALQVRQRLLAETALMSLGSDATSAGTPQSALFAAPADWDPGVSWFSSDFFDGLRAPWLNVTTVDALLSASAAYTGEVADPAPAATAEADPVPTAELIETSTRLTRRARTLARLVGGGSTLVNWYDAAAALGVSAHARDDGLRRLLVTQHTAADLKTQLNQVSLDGPPFVTLSSSRGTFGVTISNGLDRPVTVGVRVAAAVDGLEFDAGDPVTVGPGERQTVNVDARVGDNRVARVRAYLVTRGGERFGPDVTFNVRTSVVGVVVWVLVGIAGLLLLVAIVRRVVLRIVRPAGSTDAAAPT